MSSVELKKSFVHQHNIMRLFSEFDVVCDELSIDCTDITNLIIIMVFEEGLK
jgi:hypothetical protein